MEKLIYHFRDFLLEPDERRLSEAGKPIALTPKVFDTLVLLVERSGHVVSKDELMRLLWPRGYVDESNLTKHIWLIRRALGEVEKGSPFIETVPKLGYRFVAPVTKVGDRPPAVNSEDPQSPMPVRTAASPPPSAPVITQVPAENGPASRRLLAWLQPVPRHSWLLGLSLTVILTLTIGWLFSRRPSAEPAATGRSAHTVAFVGFNNLSGNAKDAWIAPAMIEMLGAELNVAQELRVVPDELVRDAARDLAAPAAGGYAPETIARLRRRLDADYIISGSYLLGGATDEALLRIDVALQDARTGELLASLSNQSTLHQLIPLVTGTGVRLREKVGIAAPAGPALGQIANSQPPTVDVARRVAFAVDALRNYDPARARDELLEAVTEAPGYAPAYAYLAEAWSALGYRDKALAAAAQAAQHAANLPPEQQLQAEAVFESERSDWNKAINAWRALVKLKPLDIEYRLRQIDAQIAAGEAPQAQVTLAELRKVPNTSEDARIELAASRLAAALDDAKGDAEHATNALRQAQQHDAAGLTADAQLELATLPPSPIWVSGKRRAHTSQPRSTAIARIHNPRGEAAARRTLAAVLANLSHTQDAREEYQRALALDQSVDDAEGVAPHLS